MKFGTKMTPGDIWAKSPEKTTSKYSVSLAEHIGAVYAAATCMFDEVTPFLPAGMDQEALKELVYASAVLHDIGKANSAFQDMLRGELRRKQKQQPLRHEVLSALITTGMIEESKDFADWLREQAFAHRPPEWVWMVAWAAGGHHLKLHHYADHQHGELARTSAVEDIEFYGQATSATLAILDTALLEAGVSAHGRPNLPDFALSCDLSQEPNHVSLTEEFVWESEERTERLDESSRLLLAYAKAIVISADIAGSAFWTTGVEAAVQASLRKTADATDLTAIVQAMRVKTPTFSTLRPFQVQAAHTPSPALLIAACGGGKTVAAYQWAKQYEGRKLFFCYPTTGTASAGFADYLFAQSDLERALIHSRAEVDIEHMTRNGEGGAEEDREVSFKVESLQAWGQQVIACTADTVLGLVQNSRRALFSFPAIVKAAIVFDEIHSYDAKLFGALVRFLWAFPQVPVLLMSASLPQSRLDSLHEALGERWQEPIEGDEIEESRARYLLAWREKKDDCWDMVLETLRSNGKVLWVCNTVSDAVAVFRQAKEKAPEMAPILYHSRFRYKDRVDIQSRVVAAFKEEGNPCLAVTTQVCEMSLDISAQLMVTALPPFPSLVQRLGRLNRRGEVQEGAKCLVYPFSCRDGEPYRRSELKESGEIIKRLCGGGEVLSQAVLRKELDTFTQAEEAKLHSSWLDGGWESRQATLREGGATITVLLEQDREAIKEAEQGGRGKLAAWTVPVLYKSQNLKILEMVKDYPLVDGVLYSEETGAEWHNEK